jgi:hypothetical protein
MLETDINSTSDVVQASAVFFPPIRLRIGVSTLNEGNDTGLGDDIVEFLQMLA